MAADAVGLPGQSHYESGDLDWPADWLADGGSLTPAVTIEHNVVAKHGFQAGYVTVADRREEQRRQPVALGGLHGEAGTAVPRAATRAVESLAAGGLALADDGGDVGV